MPSTLASRPVPAVPAKAYWNVSRPQREQVARDIGQLKALDLACQPVRRRFEERCVMLRSLPSEVANRILAQEFGRLRPLLRRPSLPFHLLACGWCGHLIPDCVCADGSGDSVEYGTDLALLDWIEIGVLLAREKLLPAGFQLPQPSSALVGA